MDASVEEKAKALARAIRESDEYEAWVKARAEVEERHAAQVMLRDLQAAQTELLRKVQSGETVTQEEEARWQRTVETVAYNPYVAAVLQAEQALLRLIETVNETLAKELELHVPSPAPVDDGPKSSARKSRLWIPGQP